MTNGLWGKAGNGAVVTRFAWSRVSPAGEVEAGADDAVGVDSVVAVDVLDRARLAEPGHAEGDAGHLVDGGQERERVRVPVQDGDQRGGAGSGEHLVQDPRRR